MSATEPVNSAPARRMTRQRAAVLAAFRGSATFRSAQQVHQDLLAAGKQVSLATVYRNLRTLEEAGRLDSVRGADGEARYRLCATSSHHHHLVCEVCGRAEDLDLSAIEPAFLKVAATHGFELTSHDLELFGRCSDCGR